MQNSGHRRRRDSGHKPNHERWMISYADLLTLLLAVFIVLYATSAQNKSKLKQMAESMLMAFNGTPPALVRMPSSPHGPMHNLPRPVHIPVQSEPAPAQKRNTVIVPPRPPAPVQPILPRGVQKSIQPSVFAIRRLNQELSHLLAPEMRQHTIQLLSKPLSITIRLNAKILFHSGHASLTPAAVQLLKPLGEVLKKVPAGYQVSIQGYTDNNPIHTAKYPSNWQLSTARAMSVLLLFRSVHVSGDLLNVEGFSKYHPLESNKTASGQSRNRRVEIRITAPRSLRHGQGRDGANGLKTTAHHHRPPTTAARPSSIRGEAPPAAGTIDQHLGAAAIRHDAGGRDGQKSR